jgi:hypothetical protein
MISNKRAARVQHRLLPSTAEGREITSTPFPIIESRKACGASCLVVTAPPSYHVLEELGSHDCRDARRRFGIASPGREAPHPDTQTSESALSPVSCRRLSNF